MSSPCSQPHQFIVPALKYKSQFWANEDSAALTLGRLLIGRIIFHFGKEDGWSFLVNGNIKDTADFLWFVRDRNRLPLYPGFSSSFAGFEIPANADCAIMTPCGTDKIRFFNFPNRVMTPLKTIISSCWAVQSYTENKDFQSCHQFKLFGNPWWSSGIAAIRSRILVMKCILVLLGEGFRPRTALDVSRKQQEKGCIIFCPCQPIYSLQSLVISITGVDHLRLIGDISEAEEFCLKSALQEWPFGYNYHGYTDELGGIEGDQRCLLVKFKGYPWASRDRNQRLHARMVLQLPV